MHWKPAISVILIGLCLLILSTDVGAQGRGRGRRRGRFEQDREAIANGWQFDYEAAKRAAVLSNKPMMVVFRCVP